MGYYIKTKAGLKGPFSVEKLRSYVDQGKIPDRIHVIDESNQVRIPVRELLDEGSANSSPPPVPAAPRSSPRPRRKAPSRAARTSLARSPRRPATRASRRSDRVHTPRVTRPALVTFVAWYHMILSGIFLFAIPLIGIGTYLEMKDEGRVSRSGQDDAFMLGLTAFMCLGFMVYALLYFLCGRGLLKLRWGSYRANFILTLLGTVNLNPLTLPGWLVVTQRSAFEAPPPRR